MRVNLPSAEPVLILGASGFIGSNLLERLVEEGATVIGTYLYSPPPPESVARWVHIDLLEPLALESLLKAHAPKRVFNLASYGNVSTHTDTERIFQTNVGLVARVLKYLAAHAPNTQFIQVGSSSEYGLNAAAPRENHPPTPNSLYGISKYAASQLIEFFGKQQRLATVSLRPYSVYGPRESEQRLIPRLLAAAEKGCYPPLADPQTPHDFLYVEDLIDALKTVATALTPQHYGEIYNVGTGVRTTLSTLTSMVQEQFGISQAPQYGQYPNHAWDVPAWQANWEKISTQFGWIPKTTLAEGLQKTRRWRQTHAPASINARPKRLSLIVACYNDAEALPELVERSLASLTKLGCEAELILVNDGSQDNTEQLLETLSQQHRCIVGVTHTRNFGSQQAFRSGMELMTGDACVLLDGDLQDPPELVEAFYQQWQRGYDVVFGIRKSRSENPVLTTCRKLFYRAFSRVSDYPIPLDAGDFSLLDKKVVAALLNCGEADPFWRGLRAYVGFKQIGIPYHRPKRPYGASSNNFMSNVAWARKAIFSHGSRLGQYFFGLGTLSLLLFIGYAAFVAPTQESPAWGLSVIAVIASIQLLGVLLLNERVELIFKEVKRRPRFIRRSILRHGIARDTHHV